MRKKILVTGGLGFIGSYFVEAALQAGYYVINLDKRTYAARDDLDFDSRDHYEFIEDDISEIKHLPVNIDYIINFAAESHVDNSIMANEDFFHSNVRGVYNLLELVRSKDETDRPKLIHVSTDEVYGTIFDGCFSEVDPLNPSNPYSATKAAAEQLILGWRNTYGLPIMVCRTCNNYGFGQYPEKLLAKTIEFLLSGKPMTIHGDGSYRREWLYAGDHARAILLLMEKGELGEVYNISSNEEHSVLEAVQIVLDEMGHDKDSLVYVENRVGQDRRYSVDCSKIRALGWEPTTTLREYMPEYVKLYKKYLKAKGEC
ncbi:dTDP-glucose 4,6-dehydratase [Kiritimatiella glycovorans]|uniref:dTDP-glucose 4,6-dehydratase n=1 Tax=Kiritimatiella glycovorans TaxID=1307763 RepID=A0A0G3EMZ8_9BACT|nr:GDP-mannose 4,6-dehydratase [Kiritimatiella glycovorans]AKJ65509.1 dTDP-glucose 4,6-dehydratase [Kiritimatiella glycovorans]